MEFSIDFSTLVLFTVFIAALGHILATYRNFFSNHVGPDSSNPKQGQPKEEVKKVPEDSTHPNHGSNSHISEDRGSDITPGLPGARPIRRTRRGSTSKGRKPIIDFPLDQYKQGDILGKGGYGQVYKYIFKEPIVPPVAVKMIQSDGLNNSARHRQAETSFSKLLVDHPNIVTYKGINIVREGIQIIQELCFCSLRKLLKERDMSTPSSIAHVIRQVTSGLSFLHSKKYVHRDIKPDNILVQIRGERNTLGEIPVSDLNFKIGDFGLARNLPEAYNAKGDITAPSAITLTGTKCYMAPEIVKGGEKSNRGKLSFAVDIWAVGIIAYEMSKRKASSGAPKNSYLPFGTHELSKTKAPELSLAHLDGDATSDPLRSMLTTTLSWDPKDRPVANDLLRDVFLTAIATEKPAGPFLDNDSDSDVERVYAPRPNGHIFEAENIMDEEEPEMMDMPGFNYDEEQSYA